MTSNANPSGDRPAEPPPQDHGPDVLAPWLAPGERGRLRLATLIALRWRGIVGQGAVLGAAALWLDGGLPWGRCLALVAASAGLNVVLSIVDRRQRGAPPWQNAAILATDIVQLSALLYLTGGVMNPFSVLLVAPIALAAATVRSIYVLGLVALSFTCVAALAVWSLDLPGALGAQVAHLPQLYKSGVAVALEAAIGFTASYAWRASVEAERMELALNVTQQVLSREQRLSALGALAAAAAHELGTPLATMQIVSREIARSATDPALREDAELLIEQAARCREILKQLSETPEAQDAVMERISLPLFLNELIEPHHGGPIRVEAVAAGPPGEPAPDIQRLPEIIHALNTLVENAADFAKAEVLVRARFDERSITIEVHDDGPGFAPEILSRLGEPYVTSRPHGEGSRSGHVGMGLGFFIAKTLLEKTGAVVSFENGRRGGAIVAARWPRIAIEAPAARDFAVFGA